MSYRGRVQDGVVVLEPGVRLPEGRTVSVELVEPETASDPAQLTPDPLSRMADLAVETGISDLSVNIDHYLYGHPKVNDER
ncbi:MAG TPA: hypothetical protein VIL86_01420 [Tepidisphaeraceae bacterium]